MVCSVLVGQQERAFRPAGKVIVPSVNCEDISALVIHSAFKAQFDLNLKQMFFESAGLVFSPL